MRLIDAYSAKEAIEYTLVGDAASMAERVIDRQPTVAAVPVVRCRECKLWHEETGFCEKNSYFVDGDGVCCSPADSPNWTMFNPDDFCSYGERKEGVD